MLVTTSSMQNRDRVLSATLGADLRTRGVLGLRADGSPYPLDEQPLARALTGRTPVSDVVYLRSADGALQPFTMTSLPFFNPDGELIGVGNYVTSARVP